ncbi:carnitine dehydratase [Micromonospora globispora]|uniref:CaiB/BaiF CoA transferase family protein n=1 Tax=Micromonospora globispora TaxID=1450148 RepID=UPI000D7028C3|nr:CaiB/BaiF CoA-transferase family protein [Micromonospora globispora]PWU61070.1 carnitine dehydratase [Micromonospora globispora]RQW98972.1 carnitine dehydratase [Micromonospora globispora]
MGLPLDGIVVVSVEQAVAVPFASRHLADLGAEVIKIERPDTGDFARDYDDVVAGLSAHFVWLNRTKKSVALDLKSADGRQVLNRLLDRCDVFLQNLAPGAMERLGFGAQAVRATRPGLITGDLSGFGDGGPDSDRRAYDLLIQSEAGLLDVTGSPDGAAKVGIPIADIAAGMYLFSAVLTALYERSRTGHGRELRLSMLESLGEWMGFPFYYGRYAGAAPRRSGASHASIAPYGPVRLGDGESRVIAVQNNREWARFAEIVLGDAALATDERFATNPARMAHRDELIGLIETRFGQLTSEAAVRLLNQAQIAHAQQSPPQRLADHPQLIARDRVRQIDSEAGPLVALESPTGAGAWPTRMGRVPALGQDTDEVIAWLGFAPEDPTGSLMKSLAALRSTRR